MVSINEIVETVDTVHTRLENLIVQESSEDLQSSGVRLIEGPLELLTGLVEVELQEGAETGGEAREETQPVCVGEERAGEGH